MGAGDLADESTATSMEVGPVAPGVPEQMGRYLLAYEFATGGMATVYLAREMGHSGMKRAVALKCIHPHLAKKKAFVEMFLDEARVAARINHPNVCSVYDFGDADGTYYIAMEYLLGETLSRTIRRMFKKPDLRPAPLKVAQVIADCCEGLHAAHDLRGDDGEPLGVVHRDVSPSNLYICYDGSARVVDFGIAKAQNRVHETRTGEIKGKLAYLAPEQVDHLEVDRRADIWSLGVCLWEALTGKRLFRRRSDAQTILAVLQGEIPPPSAYQSMPEGMDEILKKALQRDPKNRYQTARELGRDLRRVMMKSGELVGAPEVAEWMTELFPMEKVRRFELVEKTMAKTRPGDIGRVESLLTGDRSKTSGIRSDVVSEVIERGDGPPGTVKAPGAELPEVMATKPIMEPESVPVVEDEWGDDDEFDKTVAEASPFDVGAAHFGSAVTQETAPETPGAKDDVPVSSGSFELPSDAIAIDDGGRRKKQMILGAIGAGLVVIVGGIYAMTRGEPEPVSEPLPPLAANGQQAAEAESESTAAAEAAAAEAAEAEAEAEAEAAAEAAAAEAEAAEAAAEAEAAEAEAADAEAAAAEAAAAEAAAAQAAMVSMTTMGRTMSMASAMARAPGTVTIVSIGGWADVYERGRSLGRTPARLELSPGRHVLIIKPFGRNPAIRRVVRVRSGSSARVAVQVQR